MQEAANHFDKIVRERRAVRKYADEGDASIFRGSGFGFEACAAPPDR